MAPAFSWTYTSHESEGRGFVATTRMMATVLLLCVALGLAASCGGSTPTSTEVVEAFEEEGLPVENTQLLSEDPEWGTGMVPKTENEGTRFEIPGRSTLGEPAQGLVFTYESREDLDVMKRYYETLNDSGGGMFYSHLYNKGLVLIRIDGTVPKNEADRYGEVLERM